MPALFVFLWLGCDHPEVTDGQHYARALSAPIDDAAAGCAAIGEPSLRGDCQASTAVRLARAGRFPEAAAQCDHVTDEMWHDECWFNIADAARLVEEDALHACRKSGRYQVFCRRHLLQRMVAQMEIPVGGEHAAIRQLGADISRLTRMTAKVTEHTANSLIAEHLSRRWAEQPFDPTMCGALTTPLCRHAYWYGATRLMGGMRTVCADKPLRSASTEAAGMSGYTGAGAPIAESVWRSLCAQIDGGMLVPEKHGASKPARLDGGTLPLAL